MQSSAYRMSQGLHLSPVIRHDLFVSLLAIKILLLIEGQSLQPLPCLDEHGIQ